ncbi:hypothetical protein M6B38_220015 [Iris pallida]|uniref:Uncharacterized protein n=1 Tax=Iris pallida TaxID=29817 RepID=A0AAX6DY27_IRIPA|nr:hypothetical protein M6B38_220015 [Iris pallida]
MSRKGCTKENFYKGKILSLQPAATMRLQISAAATMRLQIGAASPCASIQAHPAISSAAQLCASSPAMCIPSAKFFQPGSPRRAEPSYAPLFQPGSADKCFHKAFNPLAGTKEEKSTANAVARGGFERASKGEGRP